MFCVLDTRDIGGEHAHSGVSASSVLLVLGGRQGARCARAVSRKVGLFPGTDGVCPSSRRQQPAATALT